MRCVICRGWIGLRDQCSCGYNVKTRDVEAASASARKQRRDGGRLMAIGLAALVGVVVVGYLDFGLGEDGSLNLGMTRILMILLLAAIFGFGRGTWQVYDGSRRLRVCKDLSKPAAARVVSRS